MEKNRMHAVLFTQNRELSHPPKCGICKKEHDHGWSIHPQSLEEENFLDEQFKDYMTIYFCDICLERFKKECEINGFSLKISKDGDVPDWVVDPAYLPNDEEE